MKRAVNRIPLWVFTAACILEVPRLYQDPWILKAIRSTFVGRTLMGATFDRRDFPPYALGCLFGWLWIQYILKVAGSQTGPSETKIP